MFNIENILKNYLMKIASYQIENYIKNIASAKIAGALIFGPEESVVSFNSKEISKKIVADLADPFLVVNLTKERFAQENSCLDDEFYSFSMLGGRKLIVLRDIDANVTSSFKALLSQKSSIVKSENFILIQAGDLDKSSAIRKLAEESPHFAAIACYEDDEKNIKKFIEVQLQKNDIEAEPDCIQHLYDKLGKNRQIIILEIEKISSYLDGAELTIDLINRAIGLETAFSTNEFINNFIEKKIDKALPQAEYLMRNGFEAIVLIRFLSAYIQKLYHAKIETDIAKIDLEVAIKMQKLFFKTEIEFRKHLRLTTLDVLIYWLQALEEIEIKIKTNSIISSKLLLAIFLQENLKK